MAEELSSRVIPRQVEDEVRSSYLTYAMSVIVSRALPDARDGLKPVHRRLLHAMNEMGLRADRPYRKTARVVGEVLGKFHPHGEQAVYDALVRMAQDFSLRYPVIDGQGNFGSIDGDPPAAQRYTEARLAPIAQEMLADIGKETVDFQPNYDDHLEEPVVLPGAFPFLMANGASGIAVGMATNMPPHNLREVARAVASYIDNPRVTVDELMRSITGPDFPTGGIIYGRDAIAEAYRTGRGRIPLRGRLGFETLKSGREAIVVTEIPYQVNKATMVVRIADLHRNRRIEGIADLRDESDRRGMRVVIEIKRGIDPKIVLNRLFNLTQLQDAFYVNALALVGGKPKVLTLRDMLWQFIQHRRKVVTRRARFDLKKAEQRAHILEGLKIALDNIDEVVRIIRASRTVELARNGLRQRFELSVAQAQAILDMRLQRLTSLETHKVEEELAQVRKLIGELRELLASEQKIFEVVKKETQEIATRYGDDRRTEIVETEVGEFNYEDLIEEEDMVVVISNRGIIKRIPSSSYRRQMRGGKGAGSRLRGTDFISQIFIGSTHDYVLFITSAGRAYWLKIHELPERTRQTVGQDLRALLQMEDNEEVTAIVSLSKFSREEYLFMATARGVVKKVRTSDFSNAKRRGVVAINLDPEENGDGPGDHLVAAMLTDGKRDVVLIAASGKALRFAESAVRPVGRATRGVRGLKLQPGDRVVGAATNDAHRHIFIISERGFGKRMDFDELTAHSRGTLGQYCYRQQEKNGPVVAMIGTYADDDLVCITTQGQVVKLPQQDVPVKGRSAALGVKIVRLREGDSVAGVARVAKEE
jgi:DNA gyrase subunit A